MNKLDSLVNGNKSLDYRDLGLYIHIPFCAKKCDYCDFLSAPATQDVIHNYFEAMLTEIETYRGSTGDYVVPTIFFGGGTPSVVAASYIERIMNAIRQVFVVDDSRLEVTIEMNPGTITKDKLEVYRQAGINRLSIGLQSVNNEELSLLGRIHTYEQFEDNYKLARELGFHNINIDLMSALPGQTLQTWEHTLNKVIGLKPEHISAYSLIIEEDTKFYEQYHEGAKAFEQLPDEDTDRRMYHRTKEILLENGYHRYEISNYAKPSYECRHNSSYWVGTDYLGIGLGAASLIEGTRFSNEKDLNKYIELCNIKKNGYECSNQKNNCKSNVMADSRSIRNDCIGLRTNIEELTLQQKMEEFMLLGLRICAGVSKKDFLQRFGIEIDAIYGEVLKQLSNQKLLEMKEDIICLTEYGIDVSNYVLAEFLLDVR